MLPNRRDVHGTGQPAGRPGTNRDGTARCPFVPGQINFLVPVSLCPRTRAGANVPGQTPLSRDKITFLKNPPEQEKDVLKQEKEVLNRKGRSKTGKVRSKTGKDVLKQEKVF
jgi:hypothetical protein